MNVIELKRLGRKVRRRQQSSRRLERDRERSKKARPAMERREGGLECAQ